MLVFLAHLVGGSALPAYAHEPAVFAAILPWWNFSTNAVYFFFIISGFVILPSAMKYQPREFAFRRFLRIYPLFFVLTLLYIVLNLLSDTRAEMNDPLRILFALTFLSQITGTGQLTPNAWSLTFEVWFYALTGLVALFAIHKPQRIGLILAGLAVAAFTARFPLTFFFLGGVAVRLLSDSGRLPSGRYVPVFEGLSFVLMAWLMQGGKWDYHPSDLADPKAVALILVSTLYFMFAIAPSSLTSRLLPTQPLLYLGTISYSLFLVHPYVYLPMRMLFTRLSWFGPNEALSLSLFVFCTVPLGLLVSHVCHKTIETGLYQMVFRQKVFSPK
jgi:peptidoglycan/LPS O-acetylase OafA/YrhL